MSNNHLHIQKQASNPNYSVYVNASAGSGKTKVLIDRMLRLLLKGNNLSNILCVTFTNAAAEEMIERLKGRAKKWCAESKGDLVRELEDLIDEPISESMLSLASSLYGTLLLEAQKIKIQTMHAFCARILNIEIDSAYTNDTNGNRIISNAEKYSLLKRAYYEAMRSEFLQKVVRLLALLFNNQILFEYTVDLINQYAKFHDYLKDIDTEERLLGQIFQLFGFEQDFDWEIFLEKRIVQLDMPALYLIAESLAEKEGRLMKAWLTSSLAEKKENLFEYANIFLTQDHKKRSRISGAKSLNERMQAQLYAHQEEVYEIIQTKKSYNAALHNFAFIRFAQEVFKNYEEFKREKGLLDYDQLLINTIKLLETSENRHWLLWKLDCEIDHILVDEAQDLNAYQWQIIKLLSEEFFAGIGAKEENRTIFIVGDQKQSIFGFQGAAPEIFVDIARYYKEKARHALKEWVEIDFNISFRSGKEILELVDNIFIKTDITAQFNTSYKNHISYRNTPAYFQAWQLNDETKNTLLDSQWMIPAESASIQRESIGSFIATRVSDWLKDQRVIFGSNKNFELDDLMIILRKRGRIYNDICNALSRNQIPFVSCGSLFLKDKVTILDLLSLLKFILNQADDFNLANLLKSALFNFKEEDIFKIAFNRGKRTIWQSISEGNRYQPTREKLLKFLELFADSSLYQFFYQVAFEYYKKNSFDTAIKTFLNAVANFEQQHQFAGELEFLHWFEAEKIQVLDSCADKNAIRITTAHSAKGLEAPIIILADAFESENLSRDNIFWLGNRLIFSSGAQYDDKFVKIIKEKAKFIQKNENLRLLYVAVTRARDEVYVIGYNKGKIGNWHELICDSSLKSDPLE
ncbi:MAG: 3?-5? helicase subunit RecB of the DNA repair enzyme RecBCD (exonuclease V) [Candidatus Midichloria mitochondrii]|nr:UvrD-helicase domain-containing protein [Candidatus Midichloria mitochondrii]